MFIKNKSFEKFVLFKVKILIQSNELCFSLILTQYRKQYDRLYKNLDLFYHGKLNQSECFKVSWLKEICFITKM